jgi:hypothetical protein
MPIPKKKTRKSIGERFKEAIVEHGPVVAEHLATALTAATVTYLGISGKKSRTQLKKVAKTIPGGKKILKVVSSKVPFLKRNGHESNGGAGTKAATKRKRGKRSKNRATA